MRTFGPKSHVKLRSSGFRLAFVAVVFGIRAYLTCALDETERVFTPYCLHFRSRHDIWALLDYCLDCIDWIAYKHFQKRIYTRLHFQRQSDIALWSEDRNQLVCGVHANCYTCQFQDRSDVSTILSKFLVFYYNSVLIYGVSTLTSRRIITWCLTMYLLDQLII